MAKKQDTLVVFDQTLEGTTGKLRIVFEIPKTETNADLYHKALKDSRGIPFEMSAINPLDPMYQYVLQHMKYLEGNYEGQKAKVRNFYDQLNAGAYRDAIILALTSSKFEADGKTPVNQFDFEPTPYGEDDEDLMGEEPDSLPGLVNPPRIKPDLSDPTEYRLKQLYDFLRANMNLMPPLIQALDLAVIKINELAVKSKTDENGFSVKQAS